MTWVRLDDDFPNHPKILNAGPLGSLIQVRSLCYASHHLTNGFIPIAAEQWVCEKHERSGVA